MSSTRKGQAMEITVCPKIVKFAFLNSSKFYFYSILVIDIDTFHHNLWIVEYIFNFEH